MPDHNTKHLLIIHLEKKGKFTCTTCNPLTYFQSFHYYCQEGWVWYEVVACLYFLFNTVRLTVTLGLLIHLEIC